MILEGVLLNLSCLEKLKCEFIKGLAWLWYDIEVTGKWKNSRVSTYFENHWETFKNEIPKMTTFSEKCGLAQ